VVIPIKTQTFNPQDITLRDDAAHIKQRFSGIETWYYDGFFNEKYSIVALINILTLGKTGVIRTGLFIYKDAKLVQSLRQKHPYKKLYASEETPDIRIDGKQLLLGEVNTNGVWQYQIKMGNENLSVDIKLEKKSKGWMGKTTLGSWLAIPYFNITGTLRIKGEAIALKGRGYHDHNVYSILAPFKTKGYHFGNINLKDSVITWGRVIKNRKQIQTLSILTSEKKFISFRPEEIHFVLEKKRKEQRKNIPDVFSLKIQSNDINLDVAVETKALDHIKMPTLNYWRYHTKNKGLLKTITGTEEIDSVEIAEMLRFF